MVGMYHLSHHIVEDRRRDLIAEAGGTRQRSTSRLRAPAWRPVVRVLKFRS